MTVMLRVPTKDGYTALGYQDVPAEKVGDLYIHRSLNSSPYRQAQGLADEHWTVSHWRGLALLRQLASEADARGAAQAFATLGLPWAEDAPVLQREIIRQNGEGSILQERLRDIAKEWGGVLGSNPAGRAKEAAAHAVAIGSGPRP